MAKYSAFNMILSVLIPANTIVTVCKYAPLLFCYFVFFLFYLCLTSILFLVLLSWYQSREALLYSAIIFYFLFESLKQVTINVSNTWGTSIYTETHFFLVLQTRWAIWRAFVWRKLSGWILKPTNIGQSHFKVFLKKKIFGTLSSPYLRPHHQAQQQICKDNRNL